MLNLHLMEIQNQCDKHVIRYLSLKECIMEENTRHYYNKRRIRQRKNYRRHKFRYRRKVVTQYLSTEELANIVTKNIFTNSENG